VDPRGCGAAALFQPAAWPAVKGASGLVMPQVRKPTSFLPIYKGRREPLAR
jgi:hypothetical protein